MLELAEFPVHFLFLLLKYLVLEFFHVLRLLIVELLLFLFGRVDQAPLVIDGFLDLLLLLHFTEQIIIDFSLVEDLVFHLVELCSFMKLHLLKLLLNL